MSDTVMFLAGRTLPKYLKLTRLQPENTYTNETLDGTIYTDFYNRRRVWEIEYDIMKKSEYEIIQDIWEEQFETNAYPAFQFDALNIYAIVRVEIDDQDIIFGADWVENVKLVLTEQQAIS